MNLLNGLRGEIPASVRTVEAKGKRAWADASAAALVLALSVPGGTLQAQTLPSIASGDVRTGATLDLEEITVTATRQNEQLSKVPISLAAYSEDSMDQLGVRTI